MKYLNNSRKNWRLVFGFPRTIFPEDLSSGISLLERFFNKKLYRAGLVVNFGKVDADAYNECTSYKNFCTHFPFTPTNMCLIDIFGEFRGNAAEFLLTSKLVGISMTIDKRWTTIRHSFNHDFIIGLKAFIERCKIYLDSHGKCSCPCKHCGNTVFLKPKHIKDYIIKHEFEPSYTMWRHHGELSQPPEVHNTRDPLRNFLHDIQLEEVPNFAEEGPNDDETMNDTTVTSLEDLIDSTQTELYPGSKLSSLEFLAKLTHIKVLNKWTDTSFDQLLELLTQSHPPNNTIPKSFYETKKWMRKISLGYQAIHACKNDCCLFYKEYQDLKNCPICNESRWKDERTTGKKVPNKVLRYFPITPRLKRLYSSRYTAKDLTWHATGRCNEEGKMRHLVDGRSWKEIDKRYPDFAREHKNIRIGLAADGFNPFVNMNNPYSMWPVILTTYNSPPCICMKESSLMLTLLIPGPKSPGKDIDIYLRPLVDELKILWSEGVITHDSVTNTHRPNLESNHPYRESLEFNGKVDHTSKPRKFKVADIENQLTDLLPVGNLGKNHTNVGEKIKRPPKCRHNWTKISIFRNKAKPEGCIAEGYVVDEALTACSMSLEGIQTRFNRPDRYADGPIRSCEFRVFKSLCKFISKGVFKSLARDIQDKLHCQFKAENPNMDMKTNFPSWFTNHIRELRSVDGSKYSDELICLAEEPVGTSNHYSSCNVNGVRFVVSNRDDRRTTQNNGIATLADVGAPVSKYYGRLEDIVELHYGGAFRVVLFRCRWFNTENTRNPQQAYYIDDPSKTSSNWKVVHEVHHRKLWDRDIIEDTIRDVVHETNSADLSLDADLENMTYTSMSVPGESTPFQFNPPTHEVNDDDDDDDDDDICDLDPFSLPRDICDDDDDDDVVAGDELNLQIPQNEAYSSDDDDY
ncbi:uncharacterized protein [Rutidosis leptorrhynchoides]|uniref:uncharacterized protein n=1 Tax=Rutidosis leptorrhynchoides TaxID=125765 RepID=UPI003A992CC5